MGINSNFLAFTIALGTLIAAPVGAAFAANGLEGQATTVVATEKGECCPGGGQGHGGFGLTDDQLEKLNSLKERYQASTAAKKAELKVDHTQLRDIMTRPDVDKSAALALQSKVNALRDDLSNQRLGFMLDASQIFTPEQRAKMRHRFLARSTFGGGFGGGGHRFQGHFRGHGGPGGPGGPGGFHGGGPRHTEGPIGRSPNSPTT